MTEDQSYDLSELFHKVLVSPANSDAWATFYRRALPFVLGCARQCLTSSGDVTACEDIAQEVFLLLSHAIHGSQFREPQNEQQLRGLLRVMTRNQSKSMLRKETRPKRDFRQRVALPEDTFVGSRELSPQHQLEMQDLSERMLVELSSAEKRILELMLDGKSVFQIASQLECSEKTVHRTRRKIREFLEKHANEDKPLSS